jgi:minor extracellular serine protease Vpr
LLSKLIFCSILVVTGILLAAQKLQDDPRLEVLLDKSSKYVGVQHPRSLGYDGSEIRIAIIDTGVDYTHPDLFGFGPDGKVVGGFDFVENDNSPLDTNGHGTEVAGIIAADGGLKGIVPKAKILSYRVSDTGNAVSSDLIVDAINRAVQDDADIINISLGVNRTNDKIEDAMNHAVRKGIIVVAAAGNGGPTPESIGSPGRDPHAITVGATYNNLTASLVATFEIDGKRVEVLPMVGIDGLAEPVTAEIMFGKYGRQSDLVGVDAKDKILLIERGSDKEGELVYFSEKEKNSAAAGAKAIIVFNSEPGIFLGDLKNKLEGPDYRPMIPAVSMSKEDGLALKAGLENKTVGTLNTFYHPDFVSFFSSRGPVSPFYIKPDLVAPGVFVNTTSLHGRYNLTSGTSFAAPHVSGAAAILLQKNPSLRPDEVSSLISTTTDPVTDTYGTHFMQEVSGAGRLNITRAFDANLIILPSYAIFDLSPFTKTQTISFELRKLGGSDQDIQVDINVDQNATKFDHSINGNTLNVNATLIGQLTGQRQGMITVTHDNMKYHMPVLLRISEGSVTVRESLGQLDFAIDLQKEWTYTKISVFNEDSRLVDSISLTPSIAKPVFISEAGTYWIQAEIRTEKETVDVYNVVTVDVPQPKQIVSDIGMPWQQLAIIAGMAGIVAAVGLVIRRR